MKEFLIAVAILGMFCYGSYVFVIAPVMVSMGQSLPF